MDTNENSQGRKHGRKRSKKNKAEQENIPRKRVRQRRDTLTREEIDNLGVFVEEMSEIPTAFHSLTMARETETPTSSTSNYQSYSQSAHDSAVASTSELLYKPAKLEIKPYTNTSGPRVISRLVHKVEEAFVQHWDMAWKKKRRTTWAPEMPQQSEAFSTICTLPRYHVPATVTMLENAARDRSFRSEFSSQSQPPETSEYHTIAENAARDRSFRSEFSSQSQPPETSEYHTIAERTRAAKKFFRSRRDITLRQLLSNELCIYTNSEAAPAGAVSTTTESSGSSTQTQHPEVTASYLLQQYQPKRDGRDYNLPIYTQAFNKYWINDNTTKSLKSNSSAQAKEAIVQQTNLLKMVQTDITISPIEGKLLDLIRAQQWSLSNINIIEGDEYTVTYTQHQKTPTSTILDEITKQSDVTKSFLLSLCLNTLEPSNVSALQIDNASNERNGNNFQDKVTAAALAQNIVVTESPNLLQALTNTSKPTNECSTTNTIYAQNKINQPRVEFQHEQRYQIPTITGQHFTNYRNPRYYNQHHYGYRCQHFEPRMSQHHQHSAQFFRYNTPFMDPRFFPSAFRQNFQQFYGRMPGWF